MLTVGSLFSGIGGFDLGLERAGMRVVWQVEKDPFCLKILTKHWPKVRRYEDIKDIDPGQLEPVDLICGGFPCQPFSVAGKQRGKEDDRYLWPEMLRIIEGVRPAWVLLENVPGVVKLALDRVLSDLEALGYACRAFVIPACAVNAPHRRDRVWVVAYAEKLQAAQGSEGVYQGELSGEPGRVFGAGWTYGVDSPPVCRVGNGFSAELDRHYALGNAVVPQVVEFIGRQIVIADGALSSDRHKL